MTQCNLQHAVKDLARDLQDLASEVQDLASEVQATGLYTSCFGMLCKIELVRITTYNSDMLDDTTGS